MHIVRNKLIRYVVCHLSSCFRSAWKNDRSVDNKAYVPTNKEHLANILTHGVRQTCYKVQYIPQVLVPPALWLSLLMYWGATTPTQKW